MEWRLYDAKNRLSEVVNQALNVGPQRIRRHNDEVVVISLKEFERLTGKKPSLKSHLIEGVSLEGVSLEGLELERDRSDGREIAL